MSPVHERRVEHRLAPADVPVILNAKVRMLALSHPTGNVNVRHAALALCEADLLAEFWTCIAWNPDGWSARLLPARLREQLKRRTFPPPVSARARTDPWLEGARLLATKIGLSSLARHERGVFSVDAVYRRLDRRVARRLQVEPLNGLRAVYAYEDGAHATFAAARSRGLQCIYDLPIGYWRAAQKIYREEAEREPEWGPTIEGVLDSDEKLARKEAEIAGADLVIVASRFTAGTLAEASAMTARVEVVPYGAPELIDPHAPREASTPGRLRAIFVGALTQRKGLSYALEAVRQLGDRVALTLVGARPPVPCPALDEALHLHRWIPDLSNAELLREMRRHDVLLFPSLCEGFGLVILEALACGLPVIATPHTGAPDVLTEGVDGFVVPIRSADAIAGKLDLLLASPPQLAAMRDAAAAKARELRWARYRAEIARIVEAHVDHPTIPGIPPQTP